MKKLTTIFALVTLVILTSFVQPNEVGGTKQIATGNATNIYEVGGTKQIGTGNLTNTYEVGGTKQIATGN